MTTAQDPASVVIVRERYIGPHLVLRYYVFWQEVIDGRRDAETPWVWLDFLRSSEAR